MSGHDEHARRIQSAPPFSEVSSSTNHPSKPRQNNLPYSIQVNVPYDPLRHTPPPSIYTSQPSPIPLYTAGGHGVLSPSMSNPNLFYQTSPMSLSPSRSRDASQSSNTPNRFLLHEGATPPQVPTAQFYYPLHKASPMSPSLFTFYPDNQSGVHGQQFRFPDLRDAPPTHIGPSYQTATINPEHSPIAGPSNAGQSHTHNVTHFLPGTLDNHTLKSPDTATSTATRRSYHPEPPVDRSEWVMWVGNVPKDATQEELWTFFTQKASTRSTTINRPIPASTPAVSATAAGVVSIFLIARSGCAFVNFSSEEYLNNALTFFSGRKLRPRSRKCAPLICRIRKREEDLKAGVGGQRGVGMHRKWVADAQDRQQSESLPVSPVSDDGSEYERPFEPTRTDSFPSTTSSFLHEHFPKRYFILKSSSQAELDQSVLNCKWTTQKHNEEILDQAYRTSEQVYLIFSVNRSGEFYGYARMTGPVFQRNGEDHSPQYTSGTDLAKSPSPIEQTTAISAPAELGRRGKQLSLSVPINLGMSAPVPRIPRRHERPSRTELQSLSSTPGVFGNSEAESSQVEHVFEPSQLPQLPSASGDYQREDFVPPEGGDGNSFDIAWESTERLPFSRCRQLRNPWNHNREVKVSRDGTELEPSVGEALLNEWSKLGGVGHIAQPVPVKPGETEPGILQGQQITTFNVKGHTR